MAWFWVCLGILVVLSGIVLFLVWPGRLAQVAEKDVLTALQNRNVAHRGRHKKDKAVPENSLAAFRAACEAGYGIELDIQLSADGEVVVFHDDGLKRVCGVDARVDSRTLAGLKELRLLDTEEQIPTFAETLAAVAGRAPLVVELKMGPRNRLLCEKAWELLQGYAGPWCIESFDPRIVAWWRKNHPEVLRGQLSAPAGHLNSGLSGLLVSRLLTNFLARPHFIAYEIGPMPLLARFARRHALRVAWTARPGTDTRAVQADSDAVIFEFYSPPPTY